MSPPMKEPIAIIGSGCRFPGGSNSPSKLWELLREPRDLLKEIPPSRFNAKGFYHPNGLHHGNSNAQHAYLLSEDHRHFDAKFFGIKGIEANAIDPQQRILLETVYEGVDAAGLRVENLRGSDTAVYVGLMCNDYEAMLLRDLDTVPVYHATGIARSIMSNRISYFFDWHGPSMTIDTACSSSLVAVHQAVQSLRSSESRVAIAAGSNLILGPENYIAESKLKMLSPTGRSRMWDKDADGYARGEGVAAVVLKTLSAALADGDHVECLIRETGINQDGRTKGITMPSATAQISLIRDTYARAGLDLRKPSDRCQYFEAHGTGTPTGDPLEAEAISSAFFQNAVRREVSEDDALYVGSVKTIVGHTEGTAGLAAIMKASLGLQHKVVPPNMLFNQLNPAIKPFYRNLRIVSNARRWPPLAPGQPRRASVNSFGFGGANAHAILESYEPTFSPNTELPPPIFMPFTFSANSEKSLVAKLEVYSAFFSENPSIRVQDLALTLNKRKTLLPVRAAFAAQSIDALRAEIERALGSIKEKAGTEIGAKSNNPKLPSVLGIFTGQGAQYARMGAELLSSSSSASRCFDRMEQSLKSLPPSDRPQWSLREVLLSDDISSRVTEAAISQPLCTAIQVMLVDILHKAGVRFKAVVGHSSGEIGAAYAAGFINAHDAIRIAYYRGFHSHLASGKCGTKGAMMAIATSMEDAQELCDLPEFEGRITVAAINSAASVTLSGDEDAIAEAKIILNDENKKAKILKVDKAYHSYHMLQCSSPYLESMKTCSIDLESTSTTGCSWYSSVRNQTFRETFSELKGSYWNENLICPVMFSQALTRALEQNQSINAIIEVGPHPALKGPANQIVQEILGRNVPYASLLSRGRNAINALADGIGYLWTNLGEGVIDLASHNNFIAGDQQGKVLKNLPNYQWDHEQIYWQESRVSRALRKRKDPVHELLGSKCPNSNAVQMSWKNLLLTKEVPWIQGHALQGQTVFPAAGYVATALEAAKYLIALDTVEVLEIQDFVIHQAMVFDADVGVEIMFSFSDITHAQDGMVTTSFTYHAASGNDVESLSLMASGRLQMQSGPPSSTVLPARASAEPNMIEVEADRFYNALAEMGYGYTGPFRALSSLERKLDKASGFIANSQADTASDPLMVHPAMLDAAIQSVILAYCYPSDGQLWSLHVPTSIDRIKLNPLLCGSTSGKDMRLPFDSAISKKQLTGIYGDVSLYAPHSEHAMLQLEGMKAVPFTGATSANDADLFSTMHWGVADLSGEAACLPDRASSDEYELAYTLERVAYFYLRTLDLEIPKGHPGRKEGPYVLYFNYATHVCSEVSEGKHPYADKEWTNDTLDYILSTSEKFPESTDLEIMHIVGREMPRVIRGETTILEHLLPNGLLDKYYSYALGFPQFTRWLSRMTAQLAHRYPRMKILELGAGTGGATKGVFKHVENWFSSYTFTDISNGFFEKAQDTFQDQKDKMVFKVLDAEKDVSAQGFQENSYDLIIASFVLHATAKLENTMRNVRRLLKPGGYVLMAEVTNNDQIRGGFIFGALPGWWLGADDGRVLSPCVSPVQWDAILRTTGFSGVETITSDIDSFPYPGSIIVSRAVDPFINSLRRPLYAPSPADRPVAHPTEKLLMIGGTTLKTTGLMDDILEMLLRFYPHIDRVASVEELTLEMLSSTSTVLSLSELDNPVFGDLNPRGFQGLKNIFAHERVVLWVTRGRRADVPEANMTYGFVRSQLWEVPDLKVQFLDFESTTTRGASVIAESLIRFSRLVQWQKDGLLEKMLWSVEPELILKNEQFLVPRLSQWVDANDRLNSSKRPIRKMTSGRAPLLRLVNNDGLQTLEEGELPLTTANSDYIDIDVEYSSALSIRTLAGHYFIAAGNTVNEQSPVLALLDSPASKARVSRAQVIHRSHEDYDNSQLLLLFTHHLLTDYILSKAYPEETLLVHNAGVLMSYVLGRYAVEKGIQVGFTSSNPDPQLSSTPIHPHATDYDIKRVLPSKVSLFVDFSTDRRQTSLGRRIASLLPRSCDTEHAGSLFARNVFSVASSRAGYVREWLESAYQKAVGNFGTPMLQPEVDIINVAEIDRKKQVHELLGQICWNASSAVSTGIQPVDSRPLFAENKTYWLVGLTGGLGLSLCEWMIRHGAKHVVVSSRNPTVDERWARDMEALGAVVKITSCDVTIRESVRQVHQDICENLPPVAGVAQGAMVLQDVPTRNMTYEDLQRVLRPKVEGSRYLNELFQEDTLDFFVFFSSMTGVVGNMGQSNYTAANNFMCALARQRREKGLAASVINIGVVIGVGYVTREVSHADQKNLRKGGYMWMSERDFHQIFAEAVLAGRPDSGSTLEISTGLRRISPDEPYQPIWYNNPVFAKCILQREAVHTRETNNSSGPSIKVQLQAATTEEQIWSILCDCFTTQLQSLLGGPPDDAQANNGMIESRADELGIDSLIAVEVRSWFMKNLEVNVPVLKILGGASIRDLLQLALKELPKALVPNLGKQGPGFPKEENPIIQSRPPLSQPVTSYQEPSSSNDSSNDQTSDSKSDGRDDDTPASPLSDSGPDYSVQDEVAQEHSEKFPTILRKMEASKPLVHRQLPMSFSQSMFWFLTEYLRDKTTLNHFGYSRVRGKLRLNDLEKAVDIVAQRHESLRTCFFVEEDQEPMQGILETSLLRLEHRWINSDSELQQECSNLKEHVYDLQAGETMKIILLSKTAEEHSLLIGCHHINVDGISHQILMSDLLNAYNHEPFNGTLLQYPDYSLRQQEKHRNGGWESELKYWRNELAGLGSVLPILSPSSVTSRQPLYDYAVHRVDARIDPATALHIKNLCRKFRVTPFHFYLTVFKIVLFRFSEADDVCIGFGDGNRSENDVLGSIGPFVNMLPLRFRLQTEQSFPSALQEARSKTYDALGNSGVPFEVLLNELQVSRSVAHSPLFQAFIDYRQGAKETMPFGECQIEMVEFQAGRTAYDLSLDILDDAAGQPLLMMMAQTSLYSRHDTEILTKSYVSLVDAFAKEPEVQFDSPSLYSATDTEKALQNGRGPLRESTWPATLPHRIELMAEIFSRKIAIKDSYGQGWTYKKMAERTNNIALELMDSGVTKGSVVAVFQEPTSDWICSLLAILKVGAVYLPLDPGTPLVRLSVMANDCQSRAILVHDATRNQVAALKTGSATIIDVSMPTWLQGTDIPVLADPGSPAVILYTSGSTGAPKGIILNHSSFVNEVEVSAKIYGLDSEDVVLQQSALSFDMSVLQILLALSLGGTLCLVPRSARGDPIAITEIVVRERVSFTCATPSEYINWMIYGDRTSLKESAWKSALSGGEPVTPRLLEVFRSLQKADLHPFNGYGPTETTCCSTKIGIDCSNAEMLENGISAGLPSPNESIYILDDKMQPVPVGVPGEIVVGGVGVAIGYLNDEKLTDEKFVPDLFAPTEYVKKGWTKMYKTGDKGRWRRDGTLSVEGRLIGDTQIKLRGLRIELKEVEDAILQASDGALVSCVVSKRSEGADEQEFLVAHAVFDPKYPQHQRQPVLKSIPSALYLPQYMCPAVIVALDKIPINSSGKVDRKSISILPITKELQVPSNSTELSSLMSRLKDIWQRVVPHAASNMHDIGADSDFFHVGGNSILLVRLQALIQEDFQVSLPLAQLFAASTLRKMAHSVEDRSNSLSDDLIDWSAETEPELLWSKPTISHKASNASASPKVFVLTGSTGFLGQYLLRRLAEDPQVEKIHCVAVRNSQDRQSLFEFGKAVVHQGDLASPRLGLSEETATTMFAEADVVIHNGADVSHLKSYQTLRPANVNSTKELVRLCLDRTIPIHYVSTVGTAMFIPRESFEEVSVGSTLPPNNGSDGYTSSKWASERYLERIHEHHGLPVWIHRPSSITRSSSLLGEDASEMELLQNLLKYSRVIKATPSSPRLKGALDLVTAENVANGIVKSALENRPQPTVTYVHQTGDFCLPITDMKAFLETETNSTLETVALGEWADRAVAAGLHPTVGAAFRKVEDMHEGAMVFPAFVKDETVVK